MIDDLDAEDSELGRYFVSSVFAARHADTFSLVDAPQLCERSSSHTWAAGMVSSGSIRVHVLTEAAWPVSVSKRVPLKLPPQLQSVCDLFSKFYAEVALMCGQAWERPVPLLTLRASLLAACCVPTSESFACLDAHHGIRCRHCSFAPMAWPVVRFNCPDVYFAHVQLGGHAALCGYRPRTAVDCAIGCRCVVVMLLGERCPWHVHALMTAILDAADTVTAPQDLVREVQAALLSLTAPRHPILVSDTVRLCGAPLVDSLV